MKILILTNYGVGLYKFRKELLEKLLETNEVVLSLPRGEWVNEMVDMGCRFIDTPMERRGINPVKDLKLIKSYFSIIKSEKPDVVITYTVKPNSYGGFVCRKLKVPYISNVTGLGTAIENGGILSLITTAMYRAGLKGARCVFFQNASNKELFEKKRIYTGKTRLIPGSGVNLAAHAAEPYPDEDGTVRLLFVGRIMKDKGIEELLKAVNELRCEHPELSLDIVGGYDEDYSETVNKAVSEGYVHYHGRQSNVHGFMKNSHCVILPSYHEGMSNVMLEAAATARPVITTNVPGCAETFDEGISGIGCEAKSAESLKSAIEKFIALPYETKKQMGIAGREKTEREFDRNIVISAYTEEIEKIKCE